MEGDPGRDSNRLCPQKLSASYKVHIAVLLHVGHNQTNILYCLTLDFLAVSGNMLTLLDPPEDDPVSTLYCNHRLGMSCEILIQVLCMYMAGGGRRSCRMHFCR